MFTIDGGIMLFAVGIGFALFSTLRKEKMKQNTIQSKRPVAVKRTQNTFKPIIDSNVAASLKITQKREPAKTANARVNVQILEKMQVN